MKPIKVLVVCATALATSTMASVKLKQEFKRRGVSLKVETGRISDMMSMVRQTKPDVVVATAVVKRDIGVPVFDGVPLLSGEGTEKLFDEIFAYVEEWQTAQQLD